MFEKQFLFEKLEKVLPAVFSRQEICKILGGIFKPKTLSNLDSKGLGPSTKVKIGKKVGYEKDTFLHWLRQRSE